jgi:nicotinate-nucleotide adenylyltransferase
MGGAALGADVSDVPRRTVPGSIGVFGGTFDPIHNAHLAVAQAAAEACGLERVLFIPAGRPPHKREALISPAAHRVAMIELAIAGNDRFAVDRQELERPGPSYTVDTLEALHARGDVDLSLIVSAEAFRQLPTWREPRRIIELARLIVSPRDGYADADPTLVRAQLPELADRVTLLDWPRLRLSASELREQSAGGRSLRYLVPDAVAAYIGDHGLYRNQRRTT